MNWLLVMSLLTVESESIESAELEGRPEPSEGIIKNNAKHSPTLPPTPDLELLLFLAEWEDSENDQWLDPEVFATDNNLNQQLDTQKAKTNEIDPDHN